MKLAANTRAPLWQIDAAAAAVCLALTAAVYLFGWQPLLRQCAQAEEDRAMLTTHQQQAVQLEAESRMLRSQLETLQRTIAENPLQFQSALYLNRRLAQLTDLANDTGLSLTEISPGSPKPASLYETVSISLVGAGNYETCSLFLRRLHLVFPDTAVAAFNLSGQPGPETIPSSFRFELLWFTQPSLTSAN